MTCLRPASWALPLAAFALLGSSLSGRAAAAVTAPALPDGDEVRLVSSDDVAALCDELAVLPDGASSARRQAREQALGSTYVVKIASRDFSFAPFDKARQRLVVDTRAGFSIGTYELQPAGDRLAVEPGIPASAAEATALATAQGKGELSLELSFRVPSRATSACVVAHRNGKRGVRVGIEPVAFSLRRGDDVVASGESSERAARRDTAVRQAEPRVVVSPPVLTGARGRAPAPIAKVALALEPELLGCYRQGLSSEPELRGSLVLGVTVDGAGRVTEARPELDGLGASAVTSCVVSRLRGARFPASSVDRFSVPVKFSSN